ncbi:MAG: DUF1980 domain-containing protein [Thioploca sp.]|nr:DUF1980 domain-containing protein [Thioploca sp.]
MNNIIYLTMALSLIIAIVIIVAISRYQRMSGNNHSSWNYLASFFMTFILLLSVTSTHLGAANVKESITGKKESISGKNTNTEKSKKSGDKQTNEEQTNTNDTPKIDTPQHRIYKNK